jgi:hypothetical protein
VRKPVRRLELVEEMPQQRQRTGYLFDEALHCRCAIRHRGELVNALHEGGILSLKRDHQTADDCVERLLPFEPKLFIDDQ